MAEPFPYNISDEDVEDFFDSGGVLSKNIGTFKVRKAQLDMAKEIASTFNDGGIAIIEAGTGVGKSYAYLYSALKNAINHKEIEKKAVTVIATSSKALQDQLYNKDLPDTLKFLSPFKGELKYALLLGRNNYICHLRFNEFRQNNILTLEDRDSDASVLDKWIGDENHSGRKDEITNKLKNNVWGQVCADSELCVGLRRCEYADKCFFQKAHVKALESDIIITNHHLLNYDVKLRNEKALDSSDACILPPFSNLIIDEAHNFTKISRNILSERFDRKEVLDAIKLLIKKDEKMKAEYYKSLVISSGTYSEEKYKKMKKAVSLLSSSLDKFHKHIAYLAENKLLSNGKNFDPKLEASYLPVLEDGKMLYSEFSSVHDSIKTSFEKYNELDEDRLDVQVFQAVKYILTVFEKSMFALSLFLDIRAHWNEMIYYAEEILMDNEKNYVIVITPQSVGQSLSEGLFQDKKAIIFTSATISVGGNFEYFISNLFVNRDDIKTLVYDSSFDFEENMKILIPKDAVDYNKSMDIAYINTIAPQIEKSIIASGGGALVLFSSYQMLEGVYSAIKNNPFFKDNPLYKQDKILSNNALMKNFKSNLNSSLLATSTFWEGVDIPGQSLRLLIIAKLPFMNPAEPFYHGLELINTDSNIFFTTSLPQSVLTTKQGIGRLIRSDNDRGIVVILDNRIITKNYSRNFHLALPVNIKRVDDLEAEISEFFGN